MQEIGKCSLNPDLFSPLRVQKKRKGKGDSGQMHLGRTLGQSREGQKFVERQKDEERPAGAARSPGKGTGTVAFTYGPGQLGREIFTPGHGNCHNTMQLPADVEK